MKGSRYFRQWLVLGAAIFLILLTLTQFLPGGRRSFLDWLPADTFPLAVSLAISTTALGAWLLVRWLGRWRNLKRVFFVVGCLLLLVALFYAEENWRGWHTWNQFKREREAKGEHFALASLAPPPVPDEQNFAMADIAFTSYGQVLTRQGKTIPPERMQTNFVQRMRMQTTPDYPGPPNCAGDRVRGTFINLEGWQRHYRELAARTDDFPVSAKLHSPAADVLLALSKYDAAIEELRAACRLPGSRFPINYAAEPPWAIPLPHLISLRSCTQVLQLRSVAELQNGHPEKALDDVRLALQLADKIATEPLLISQLVRIAMVQTILQPIWEGLAEHKWSDEQLGTLDTELERLDFVAAYRLGMRGDLACHCDALELLRRHREKLRELAAVPDLGGNNSELSLPGETIARLIPAGWFYQNQYRCARMVEDYHLSMADASQGTFLPAVARGPAAVAVEVRSPFNRVARTLSHALGNAVNRFAHAQASVDLARTTIGLERYRLARGELPESLDALAPQFIGKVPHDVIGGQPLKYRREAEGLFVLYSVGWNETDDGGVVALNKEDTDLQSSDWVWRYFSKAN